MTEDVRRWLEENGFGQFAESFLENGIDFALLPDLTNDDLKDMGVARVADSKRILKAIAADKSVPDVASGPTGQLPAPLAEAERRQLSVLFCDLVGSTELSSRLDPEEMREVLRTYQDTVAGVILRHAGHVANYLGDGVLAYFGWPRAHEDQTSNSVRAALAAVDAVGDISTPDGGRLAARVGIATGQVVVGDLDTETGRQSGAISGETPNRAARIQGEADPGQIFIDQATRHLLGSNFNSVDKGPRDLKGLQAPETVFEVTGEAFVESRFAARQQGVLTPIVGRDSELGMLEDCWVRARLGQGQVVSVCGEPGIGKSRLVQALRGTTKGQDRAVLQYQCSPFYTASVFHPFVQQLEHAAGIARGESSSQKLAKLEATLLSTSRADEQTYALVASLLQIPAGDRYPPLNMSAERQLSETVLALIEQLEVLASNRPVLMIMEDVHWADRNTVQLLERVIDDIAAWPVLTVITYRPEFAPRWPQADHYTALQLNRLGREQSRNMVLEVSRGKSMPDDVLNQILDKTDGVPLFVEELVKTVYESGIVPDEGNTRGASNWSHIAIPSTLQDSLIARLDRLSPVRETAQIGAIIGRDFSYDLLADVSPLNENELRDGLQQLVNAELIYRRGDPPAATYQFKHALVRDAAYVGILKSRRRQFHKEVAEAIERLTPDTAATEPELLAHHYEEADLPLKAIPFWIEASKSATSRAAYANALQHAERGLHAFAQLPKAEQKPALEIPLIFVRANAVIPANGYGDPRVQETLGRITELSTSGDYPPELLPSLIWVSVALWNVGDIPSAIGYLDRIIEIADRGGDLMHRISARGYAGSLLVEGPDFEKSREYLSFVLANYKPEMHNALCELFGQDYAVNGHSYQALRLALEGYPEQAMNLTQETVDLARQQGNHFNFPLVLLIACWTAHTCRLPKRAIEWAEECYRFSDERHIYHWRDFSILHFPLASVLHDLPNCDIQQFEQFYSWVNLTGLRICSGITTGAMALAYQSAGDHTRCDELLREGEEFVDRYPDFLDMAYFYFLRGRVYERRGELEKANRDYQMLYDLSDATDAHLIQLRAATNLARLMRDDGNAPEAKELLTPIYDWFTEGHDLPDLVEAKALLEELA